MKKIRLKIAAKLLGVSRIRMLQRCMRNDFYHERCECGLSILVDEDEILSLRKDKIRELELKIKEIESELNIQKKI